MAAQGHCGAGGAAGISAPVCTSHTSTRSASSETVPVFPWRATRRSFLIATLLVILLAAAVRGVFMAHWYLLPNSDQAMAGLMARRILSGERPIFYWGQPYNGTLESYLTALLYGVGGQDYVALHVAPLCFSLLFVAAMIALAYRLYGRGLALLTGAYLAIGPGELISYSIEPGYNYLQAMACGTLALLLLLDLARGAWWRVPAAAFALGIGIWAQPLEAVYLPPLLIAGLAASWRYRPRLSPAVMATALAALIAGGLALWPVLAYNLQTQWATVRFLLSRPEHTHVSLLTSIERLILWAFPVLLGPIPLSEDSGLFQRYLQTHALLYGVTLGILALGLLLALTRLPGMLREWMNAPGARRTGEIALLTLGVLMIVNFLLSTWSTSSWSETDPRYLLPLYTLTPLALRCLFPTLVAVPGLDGSAGERQPTSASPSPASSPLPAASPSLAGRPASRTASRAALHHPAFPARAMLALVLLILPLALGLSATATAAPRLTDYRPLARLLEQRGDRAVYGDYWLVYRLTLDTNQGLLPVVVQPTLAPGLNRYAPYLTAGLQASHYAWVVPRGSSTDALLRACLGRLGVHARYAVWQNLAIYDSIPVHAACYAPGAPQGRG
jgi:4-amino-4-deoxy-L-arabinose transferase-like glycosyltransferase